LLLDFEVAPEQEAEGLRVLGDFFRSPSIEADDLEVAKQFRANWLARPFEEPGVIGSRVNRKKLLGAMHPYAWPHDGTAAEIRALKAGDVLAAFHRVAELRRIRIATAGSCDPEQIRPRLERAVGDLRGDARSAAPLPAIPPLPTTSPARRVHLVDRPQSALSHVRWSWTGATPTERLTLRVLAELLSSRAHVRIARELQLTEDYEIGYVGERAGLWLTISGRVVSTRTAELLREIGSIVDDLASSPSSAAIDSAKTRVLGRHVLSIERARDLSALLARDTFGDFQSDQLSRIEDGIRAVSTADVQVLAKRMLSSRTGTVVIVGDEATLRGPACGRRLGCSRAVRSRRQRAQALTSGRA